MDGINKVCAQCVHEDCKQFEQVILMSCPKFQSVPKKRKNEKPTGTAEALKRARRHRKGVDHR